MSAHTIRPGGRAIALAMLLATAAAACQARDAGTGGTGPAATPAVGMATVDTVRQPSVQEMVANAQAARGQHDTRALQHFRTQLAARLGTAAIQEADATYRSVVTDLQAATAAHDARGRAAFRAQLQALCGPAEPTSVIEPCDVDLAAAGN